MSRKARISAEAFQAAIHSIRSQDETSGASGRRHAARLRMEGQARIILCRTGRRVPIEVGVHDLSALGIGIVHTETLKAGERFILMLNGAGTVGARAILCQVARWQPLHDGLYAIGAAFIRELHMPGSPTLPAVAESLSPQEQDEVRKFEQRLAAFTS